MEYTIKIKIINSIIENKNELTKWIWMKKKENITYLCKLEEYLTKYAKCIILYFEYIKMSIWKLVKN